MNQKIKWLVLAIVILFLMNAATLATILYHNNKRQPQTDDTPVVSSFSGNVVNGRFFRHTLGFDNEQMFVFQEANQQFRPQTMALTLSIDSLKTEMFAEMKKETPDTTKLNMLATQIGDMHGQLKQKTFQFYLKLKSICTEQQQLQLEKFFESLFINENLPIAHPGLQRGWKKANN